MCVYPDLTINLTSKQLQRTAAERDEVARSNWHKTMALHYTVGQLIFTDESNVDNRNFHRNHMGSGRSTDLSILPEEDWKVARLQLLVIVVLQN